MNQYYYFNGIEKLGPFTIDELKEKNITQNTLIWKDGMPDWQEAKHIEALQSLFKTASPPPLPKMEPKVYGQTIYSNSPTTSKNNSGIITGIIIGICIVIVGIVLYPKLNTKNNAPHSSKKLNATNNTVFETKREKTPEEIKDELKEKEENEPLKYLSVDYNLTPTLDVRARIKGRVYNSASVAIFKDAIIRMTFFTKTNTEISYEDKVLVEFLNPNSSKSFDWKIKTPDKTKKIKLEIIDATVVEQVTF